MSIPPEFSLESIEAASVDAVTPYSAFHTSGEPYRSMIRHNPWMRPPQAGAELEWGRGWYYDTTVGRKHPDWADKALPVETKDLRRLREDFYRWGYCLIEDGVSPEQCERLRARVVDQAAAERALGIAHMGAAQQHVWALVNKSDDVVACMEHDPAAVQAGPMIERLLDEALGAGWHHLSFISNISYPGCHPQGLHQDQSLIAPYVTPQAPVLINTVYILQDVNEVNGGTLIIPGSHRLNGTGGEQYGPLPRASDKFLMRCGFQSTAGRSMVEGYGYSGNGRTGDPNGALVHVRRAIDDGGYAYIGPLSMADVDRIDPERFTGVRIQREHETYRGERYRSQMAAITAL